MSRITLGLIFCVLLILLPTFGCNARNVELKEYENGKLVRQVRTGQMNIAYWFGLDEGSIAYMPRRSFLVNVKGLEEKPDPNTAAAITGSILEYAMPK